MDCITAGNVMVHLFMQTQPKYRLTNKKLQYLLCVAQMLSLSAGRPLFEDEMRNLKNDFILEPVADKFINNRNIQEGVTENRAIDYGHDDFILPFTKKKIYEINGTVSKEDEWILVETFIRFGGYSESSLRDELNRLAPLRQQPTLSFVAHETVSEFLEAVKANPALCPDNVIVLTCNEFAENAVAATTAVETHDVSAMGKVGPVVAAPPVVRLSLLKKHVECHLEKLAVGQWYSMYVETAPGAAAPTVTAFVSDDNAAVQGVLGVLHQVTETVYCYSFAVMASDITVVLDF